MSVNFFRKLFIPMLFVLLVVIYLFPSLAGAVSEEELLQHEEQILAFWSDQFVKGSFTGLGGVNISYAKRELPAEKGALVVVNGRTEYMLKYAELFYDLKDIGYSLYTFDHRGQGTSGRLLSDPQRGYVENFSAYRADLKKFMDTIVNRISHKRLYILSHSMGGAVSALYGRDAELSGQIFCSPMFQINTSPLPFPVGNWLASSIVRLGGGKWYVFGGGPYDPAKKFKGNDLTHSEVRFEYNKRLIAQKPQNALGSPTFKWLAQSFAADKTIMSNLGVMSYPVLIIRSGVDSVVGLASQDNFCRKMPDCTLEEISGARHELLMEKDLYRNQTLKLVEKFIFPRSTGFNIDG